MSEDKNRMNRRNFLKTATAAGTAAVAGCSSSDDGNGDSSDPGNGTENGNGNGENGNGTENGNGNGENGNGTENGNGNGNGDNNQNNNDTNGGQGLDAEITLGEPVDQQLFPVYGDTGVKVPFSYQVEANQAGDTQPLLSHGELEGDSYTEPGQTEEFEETLEWESTATGTLDWSVELQTEDETAESETRELTVYTTQEGLQHPGITHSLPEEINTVFGETVQLEPGVDLSEIDIDPEGMTVENLLTYGHNTDEQVEAPETLEAHEITSLTDLTDEELEESSETVHYETRVKDSENRVKAVQQTPITVTRPETTGFEELYRETFPEHKDDLSILDVEELEEELEQVDTLSEKMEIAFARSAYEASTRETGTFVAKHVIHNELGYSPDEVILDERTGFSGGEIPMTTLYIKQDDGEWVKDFAIPYTKATSTDTYLRHDEEPDSGAEHSIHEMTNRPDIWLNRTGEDYEAFVATAEHYDGIDENDEEAWEDAWSRWQGEFNGYMIGGTMMRDVDESEYIAAPTAEAWEHIGEIERTENETNTEAVEAWKRTNLEAENREIGEDEYLHIDYNGEELEFGVIHRDDYNPGEIHDF